MAVVELTWSYEKLAMPEVKERRAAGLGDRMAYEFNEIDGEAAVQKLKLVMPEMRERGGGAVKWARGELAAPLVHMR